MTEIPPKSPYPERHYAVGSTNISGPDQIRPFSPTGAIPTRKSVTITSPKPGDRPTTPTSGSPRHRNNLDHPGFLAIRSKSTSELDIPELSKLANQLSLGVGNKRPSGFRHSSANFASQQQHESPFHAGGSKSASIPSAKSDGKLVGAAVGSVPFDFTTRIPLGATSIDEEQVLDDSVNVVTKQHHPALMVGIESFDDISTDTTPVMMSSPRRYVPPFRVGVVVSDCDDIIDSLNIQTMITSMANPVTKCQVLSLTVLNWKGLPVNDVKKTALKWIKRNYIAQVTRHEKYMESRSRNKNTNEAKNNHQGTPKRQTPYPLEFHSNQLLHRADDDTNFTDDTESNTDSFFSPNIFTFNTRNGVAKFEILVGEEGFQQLLNSTSSNTTSLLSNTSSADQYEEEQQTPSDFSIQSSSSSSVVDAIYLIVRVAVKQHDLAIRCLRARKHVLVHDPVSTALSDFCAQIKVAKEMKRFLQFPTMFVHQYRVKTFLDCVTSCETFGKIISIDAILNVSYDDAAKFGVSYPLKHSEGGCIFRLGRYCVLISTLIFKRAMESVRNFYMDDQLEDEDHKPISAHVVSCTTVKGEGNPGTDDEIPLYAKCVVQYTNNRVLKFTVQFSAAPTRQVLTVRAAERYATISEFVIPHPDGLSTCRLYDATHTVMPSIGLPEVDVVCGEAVDMPSGPPRGVIMWKRFSELCRSIEQEGWDVNPDNGPTADYTRDGGSLGLDVDKSRHRQEGETEERQPLLAQQFDSFLSVSNPAAVEVQEALDITAVSVETKSILIALTKSCQNSTVYVDNHGKSKKAGIPVPIELPEL